MSGQTLRVDPAALTSAGSMFRHAGARLSSLDADVPLAEAAAAVPQLRTGSACGNAQSAIAAATAAIATETDTYANNLESAARQYESQDQASATAITNCAVPGS